MDIYALSNLAAKELALFASERYIDDATRTVLEKIIETKGKIAAIQGRMTALERETSAISTDQARLRENIKALKDTPETKQLIARYLAKAGEQETRLEQIANEHRVAAGEFGRLQAELDSIIRGVQLERKL